MSPDFQTAAPAEIAQTLGLSYLAQLVLEADIGPIWTGLIERATADATDVEALFDISLILLLTAQTEQGLHIQRLALDRSRLYRRVHGDGSGLRILAMVTPGDLMANTPLDFLLEGSDAQLFLLYVEPGVPLPAQIPDHDVAFLAVSESEANREVLAAIGPVLANWPRPVVNGAPERIAALTRDGVCAMFADSTCVAAPITRRLDRADALAVASDGARLADHLPGAAFPVIIRPIDSHAGQALSKIDGAEDLGAYLAEQDALVFYLTAFVDYSGPDGLFRKQRIAFIGGAPFVSHLAVSEHWMVHYLSAGMAERPERRAEEAAFMAGFDTDFAARHGAAFAEMQSAFGLDYFAIDCGETRDGRLLLFEADVAMIVHAMDSEALYPYKKPVMRKLFDRFQRRLQDAAQA